MSEGSSPMSADDLERLRDEAQRAKEAVALKRLREISWEFLTPLSRWSDMGFAHPSDLLEAMTLTLMALDRRVSELEKQR